MGELSLVSLSGVGALLGSSWFITRWRIGERDDILTLSLPVEGTFIIDWGDGSVVHYGGCYEPPEHVYLKSGDYIVRVSDTADWLLFNTFYSLNMSRKLIDVKQWGTTKWETMRYMFKCATNMTMSATDAPDLSRVRDMSYMFTHCNKFNSNIDHWDVSNITDMSSMFLMAKIFNQPLSNWNVSSVENMSYMFNNALEFNQDISVWRVDKVDVVYNMFYAAKQFTQDLSNWRLRTAYTDNMFYTQNNKQYELSFDEYHEQLIAKKNQELFNNLLNNTP